MIVDADRIADAGNLALALANTRGSLREPGSLAAWLDKAGLASRDSLERFPPQARMLLADVLRLRDHIDEALLAVGSGAEVASLTVYGINRVLTAGSRSSYLDVDADGARLVEVERAETLLAVLEPIARDAARLIAEVEPRRIRRCKSEECRAWFVDTSKGGRRKWCSMELCGNRAKAARHRLRQRAATA